MDTSTILTPGLGAGTGAGAANPASSAQAGQKIADTFDQFLMMLTTQLQNQDPLSPMDTTEFTNQLVSFTQVEQQIATNQNLEKLIEMQPAAGVTSALGYIGLEIEADGNALWFDGTPTTIDYALPSEVSAARIDLLDATGRPVFSREVPAQAGADQLTWDGRTLGGDTAGEGVYTIRVVAVDQAGEPVDSATKIRGRVTGVESTDGQATLMIGDLPIAIDKVTAARR
jgi:flagellar basal-body rod modification protein FlgD